MSRGEAPQPPAGGPAPDEVADVPPVRGVDIDSAADRLDTKREVQASTGADNVGPPPHLTGNDAADASAVLLWWCSMAPFGQASPMTRSSMRDLLRNADEGVKRDAARMRQAIAARGPALVLEALQTMRRRGVAYPQVRAVAQCVKSIMADRIAAEKAQRHAPTGPGIKLKVLG